MSKELDKRVVTTIYRLTANHDYGRQADIDEIVTGIHQNPWFTQNAYGKKYLQRMMDIRGGVFRDDCVFCCNPAQNQVLCGNCYKTIGRFVDPILNSHINSTGSMGGQTQSTGAQNKNAYTSQSQPGSSVATQALANRQEVSLPTESYGGERESAPSTAKLEELFRDMDDSLMQLASQTSVRTIKKLTWVSVGIGAVNTSILIFLILYIAKLISLGT